MIISFEASFALVALAYQITEDVRFLRGKNLMLKLAKFPYGGESSPEKHSSTKQSKQEQFRNANLDIGDDSLQCHT